ncbi:phosphoheptose isomerase [candidate division LCP-89 bacterium B3_LCP]|uniref:Phosphoheptose isomerase n=1 Tax=candidate division LCP-89 bacterium B3_LCP TaxID=2012998 RepID=A0A532URM8_UNCL8|nr:MAG: phosphoheptose isomerase [candidate division LCP-89 bacterium B3_LCP]
MDDRELISRSLKESAETKEAMISACMEALLKAADWITGAMNNGRKLLICGNGGSAADSQHIATEFVVRLTSENDRRALPAIALTTDTSTLTAASNDYGFDRVFSRQVEALGHEGDVLIAISTSGSSSNVIEATKVAQGKGIKVIAFLGQDKRQLGETADLCLCIPSRSGQRIQEGHITAGHLLVALVERRLTSGTD